MDVEKSLILSNLKGRGTGGAYPLIPVPAPFFLAPTSLPSLASAHVLFYSFLGLWKSEERGLEQGLASP